MINMILLHSSIIGLVIWTLIYIKILDVISIRTTDIINDGKKNPKAIYHVTCENILSISPYIVFYGKMIIN